MSESRTTQIPTGSSGRGPMSGEAGDGTMAWMSETGDWRLMGSGEVLAGRTFDAKTLVELPASAALLATVQSIPALPNRDRFQNPPALEVSAE